MSGKDGVTRIENEIYPAGSQYVRRSNTEIRELALGVLSGTVFATWMIHESDANLLGSIFMPLLLMSSIDRKTFERDNIVHFYESIEKSAPRSINGYPIFFSMKLLNEEDFDRLRDKIAKLKNFMENEEDE